MDAVSEVSTQRQLTQLTYSRRYVAPSMHAERDIVLPFLSVSPSVRRTNTGIVSKRMLITSHYFDILLGTSFWFFEPQPPLHNFKRNPPLSAGVKYTGWGKLAIFGRSRRLSRKRYELYPHGCCGTLIGIRR